MGKEGQNKNALVLAAVPEGCLGPGGADHHGLGSPGLLPCGDTRIGSRVSDSVKHVASYPTHFPPTIFSDWLICPHRAPHYIIVVIFVIFTFCIFTFYESKFIWFL